MLTGEQTPEKHPNLREPWKPGESGNPNGRPRGARSKLTEAFLNALQQDFAEHGEAVVRAVRSERPADYLRTVAALMPKQVEGSEDGPPVGVRHEFAWKSEE